MKKLLILLSILLLIGCKPICILSQVGKDMVVYADKTGNALLPDYFKIFVPTDNCKIFDQVQDPPAGTILTCDNPIVTVRLFIIDGGTNTRSKSFTVYYADTIKPTFITDPLLLSQNWKIVDKMYDMADAYLKKIAYFDQILPVDSVFIPDGAGNSYFDGINRRRYLKPYSQTSMGVTTYHYDGALMVDSGIIETKTLVIRKPPNGKRSYSFE